MPKEITKDELQALSALNKGAIKKYGKLSSFFTEDPEEGTIKDLPFLVSEKYDESMKAAVSDILNDELFDKRQKAIILERAAQEELEKHMLEVDEIVNKYREDTEALKEEIEEDLELTRRIYAKKDKKELEYYEDTLSRLKTDLFMSEDPAAIERIAKDLLKGAEKDPALAKLLTRNGYLFAEQAKAVTNDPAELSRLRAKLSGVLTEAKDLSYRPDEKALMKMRDNLNEAIYDPTAGKRRINKLMDQYVRQAATLKAQHEQERLEEIKKEAAIMARGY